MGLMTTPRETLTSKRDELLSSFNAKGLWDQQRYNEVIDLEKRISEMPETETKSTKKPR